MIAAHLLRLYSKGILTWFGTAAQMPRNQNINLSGMREGKASLIDNDGNVNSETSSAVIT